MYTGRSDCNHKIDPSYIGAPMNTTTADRWNYTVYSSTDGGRQWSWVAGVYSGPAGYSDMYLLPDGNLAVGFQLGGSPRFSAGTAGTSLAYAVVQLNDTAAPSLKTR